MQGPADTEQVTNEGTTGITLPVKPVGSKSPEEIAASEDAAIRRANGEPPKEASPAQQDWEQKYSAMADKVQKLEELMNSAPSQPETQQESLSAPPEEQEEPPSAPPEEQEEPPSDTQKFTTELFNKYAEDYTKNGGSLSEEAVGELNELGVSKDLVDLFVAGQQAIRREQTASVLSVIGSDADKALGAYERMVAWAEESNAFGESESADFNAAMQSGNVDLMKQAVSKLKTSFEQNNGSAIETLVAPTTPGNVSAAGAAFISTEDMREAMKNPRYHKDPAYRKEVERKAALMLKHRR